MSRFYNVKGINAITQYYTIVKGTLSSVDRYVIP
jgi:hypothetical protein